MGRAVDPRPICAECGYDRSGLPHGPAGPMPCPECGGAGLAVAWPGWWRVVWEAAGPAWFSSSVGVAIPVLVLMVGYRHPLSLFGILPGLVVIAGVMATCSLMVLMPLGAASLYSSCPRSRAGRPGQWRILLTCLLADVGGSLLIGVAVGVLGSWLA